jgi:hypothetical protein
MTKRIAEFDLWRPGYGGAVVSIYIAGTTTLASVFTNEGLSVAADNPQTLDAMEAEGGVRYGKFEASLYTAQSYYLSIDGIENTGIVRPAFSSLDGEDASAAEVEPTGSSYASTLADIAGRAVNAANFGVFVEGAGGVAATNTATMNLAIAALPDGGFVNVPAGMYKVNAVDIPQGVVIKGQGVDATILQSILGAKSFTIVGANAGFSDLTLDGNSLSTGSVGVRSEDQDGVVFSNVTVTRFETGIYLSGGAGFSWHNFSIVNTETAAKIYGEDTAFEDMLWSGGTIDTVTTRGIDMSYEDAMCQNLTFVGVGFENCVEHGIFVNGAKNLQFVGCWGLANTKIAKIMDDTDALTPSTAADNDTVNVQFIGGRFDGGSFEVRDTAQDVILRNMSLTDVAFIMTTPLSNPLILENCSESGVTISGETTKLLRLTTSQNGASFGVTTSATTTKAWSIPLAPGQVVYLEGKVLCKGRNGAHRAVYHIGAGAYRPGSTLAYDTQTANFTAGTTLTGASSGATARIQADSDSGATGTLTLSDIVGEFIDNEIITDNNGSPGSATVNGTLGHQNTSLDSAGSEALRTAYETKAGFAAAFVANGSEIELQVTGAASNTLEWTAHVDVVAT